METGMRSSNPKQCQQQPPQSYPKTRLMVKQSVNGVKTVVATAVRYFNMDQFAAKSWASTSDPPISIPQSGTIPARVLTTPRSLIRSLKHRYPVPPPPRHLADIATGGTNGPDIEWKWSNAHEDSDWGRDVVPEVCMEVLPLEIRDWGLCSPYARGENFYFENQTKLWITDKRE